jgi:Fic family protein
MFDPKHPYNALPMLPPERQLETRELLKRCIKAHTSLAELRETGKLIPDQTVLINAIPLLEAKDSSEIENIVTTNDALFREASLREGEADVATKEALRYRSALHKGFHAVRERPLTTRSAVDICREIRGVDIDIRATPGTKLTNRLNGEVIYTPPEGQERIRELLANWERFLNETSDIDPLIRMAVLHYQFEAIHPFTDGNGRTGRILNILFLVQEGLLELPTLYLSRYILWYRADYYRLLLDVTVRQAWEPWIEYMLAGVETTAQWTTAKIRAIHTLINLTAEYLRSAAPKIYSHELVQVIFTQPYVRISNLVEKDIAKRQAASTYLQQLVGLDILREEKVGREKLFLHTKYMKLLTTDSNDVDSYTSPKSGDAGHKPVR